MAPGWEPRRPAGKALVPEGRSWAALATAPVSAAAAAAAAGARAEQLPSWPAAAASSAS